MNVQELLESKDISYRPSGADFLVRCLNPEHDDKNPSMRIDSILGIFHCLSCGYKGNIFKLFGEPLNALAQKREFLRRKVQEVRASSIGLSMPEEYAPYVGNWRDISPETYKHFKAFKSHLPEFISRIVFPITDITGKIVVFQGRDDTGTLTKKYYNYPPGVKLPMFPKVTPIQGNVIMVEGLFDMLNLYDKGISNAICIFGVNNFNSKRAEALHMQGVTGIDIILDGDAAGDKGAEEIKNIAESVGLHTRKVSLNEGTDPGGLSKIQVEGLRRQLYGK